MTGAEVMIMKDLNKKDLNKQILKKVLNHIGKYKIFLFFSIVLDRKSVV